MKVRARASQEEKAGPAIQRPSAKKGLGLFKGQDKSREG